MMVNVSIVHAGITFCERRLCGHNEVVRRSDEPRS